jgi:exopolyphosphatase / guanosine-5'-triphosphate,3'-diphosphate pyrophosphatase
MPVAVVDVGSNTARLLVADGGRGRVEALAEERTYLSLGSLIAEHGELPAAAIRDTTRCVERYVRRARRLGVRHVEVLVTSPGRQTANGDELLEALGRVDAAVRILSPEEEGQLAFEGVLATCGPVDGLFAVCDVGGGSTQIVVGSADGGPAWLRSVDLGSARLTRRMLRADPPDDRTLTAATTYVSRCFADVAPPLPTTAFATGGTARALRKVVGRSLGPDELAAALARLAPRPAQTRAREFDVAPWRAAALPAGILILDELARRLAVPLQVARAGIREGAVLRLLADEAAAA